MLHMMTHRQLERLQLWMHEQASAQPDRAKRASVADRREDDAERSHIQATVADVPDMANRRRSDHRDENCDCYC